MIITSFMLDNAKHILYMPADNSEANKQARLQAEKIIRAYIEKMNEFICLNPDSKCARSLGLSIQKLSKLLSQ